MTDESPKATNPLRDFYLAKKESPKSGDSERTTASTLEQKWQEFEENRSLFGSTIRMFPNWEGEIETEEWFRGDELRKSDVMALLTQKKLGFEALILLELCFQDVIGQVLDESDPDTDCLEQVLALAAQLELVRVQHVHHKLIDKETFDMTYAEWLYRAVDTEKVSVGEQLKWMWRVAEFIQEVWQEMGGKRVKEAVEAGKAGDAMQLAVATTETITRALMIKNMLGQVLTTNKEFLF